MYWMELMCLNEIDDRKEDKLISPLIQDKVKGKICCIRTHMYEIYMQKHGYDR